MAEHDTELQKLLTATRENPVLGDTFFRGAEHFGRVASQLSEIQLQVVPELTGYIRQAMYTLGAVAVGHIVEQEILPKTLAFCPALTDGELDDIDRQSRLAVAVGLMYWGDQTTDRGDLAMAEACSLVGTINPSELPSNDENTSQIHAYLTSLSHIEPKITELARPEDVPFVLDCFYQQVLHNEALLQALSRQYLAREQDPDFLAVHAAELAEITTISAGFPSIASGLYAIYRQHEPDLPPLAEIYTDPVMVDLLEVCNVTVRLWDDLGDWYMDSGAVPSKGVFVINPLNQYHPRFVERFCELARLDDPEQVTGLQRAFAEFHSSDEARQAHTAYILETLRVHVRDYVRRLPNEQRVRYSRYIELCKRVLEIGYVNRIGDIALASPGNTPTNGNPA